MSKSRIKNLRTITVDGQEYKWLYGGSLKIWKDKKVIYQETFLYGQNKRYPQVSYNLEDDKMTPKVVEKVIRLLDGTAYLITNDELDKQLNLGLGFLPRHSSFEDKRTERLWAKFNDAQKELKEHLELSLVPDVVKEEN